MVIKSERGRGRDKAENMGELSLGRALHDKKGLGLYSAGNGELGRLETLLPFFSHLSFPALPSETGHLPMPDSKPLMRIK